MASENHSSEGGVGVGSRHFEQAAEWGKGEGEKEDDRLRCRAWIGGVLIRAKVKSPRADTRAAERDGGKID